MSLITHLKPNDIFVFGSNHRGRHGAGAALYAAQHFGAQEGRWFGPTGQCYAIPTKDEHLKTLPRHLIWHYVDAFKQYARRTSQPWREQRIGYGEDGLWHDPLRFLVSAVGCGLAGYQPRDIAKMFCGAPENVVLPREFLEVVEEKDCPSFLGGGQPPWTTSCPQD